MDQRSGHAWSCRTGKKYLILKFFRHSGIYRHHQFVNFAPISLVFTEFVRFINVGGTSSEMISTALLHVLAATMTAQIITVSSMSVSLPRPKEISSQILIRACAESIN